MSQMGVSKFYFENGKLQAEMAYKAGKLDGVSKTYRPSGEVIYVDTYEKGEMKIRKPINEKAK